MLADYSVSRLLFALQIVLIFGVFSACANFGGEKGKKVVGIGMSQSSAGKYFNQSMAQTSARKFISDQVHAASFIYQKQSGRVKFNQTQAGTVTDSQIKDTVNFGKTGVAVIMEATVDTPSLTGIKCKSIDQNIYSVDDMERFTMKVRGNVIERLIRVNYKNKALVKGKSVIRNLSVKKISQAPRYKVSATVCIGDIEP